MKSCFTVLLMVAVSLLVPGCQSSQASSTVKQPVERGLTDGTSAREGEVPDTYVRSMRLLTPTRGWALTAQRLTWTDDGGHRCLDGQEEREK